MKPSLTNAIPVGRPGRLARGKVARMSSSSKSCAADQVTTLAPRSVKRCR